MNDNILGDIIKNLSDTDKSVIALIVFAVGFLFIMEFLSKAPNKKKKNQCKELIKAPPDKAHGLIFGRIGKKVLFSPTKEFEHCGVFSGTGTGKTSSVCIPTLRNWNGTTYCIDISGDICRNVNVKNKLIYQPESPKTMPYNIFSQIDRKPTEAEKVIALEELALLLIPKNATNDAAVYYEKMGRNILCAALIGFYFKGYDFIEICDFIHNNDWRTLFRMIDDTNIDAAKNYLSDFSPDNDKENTNSKQTASDSIALFSTNLILKKSIRRPRPKELSIDPTKLEKYNVFFVVDDEKLNLYAPLLNIVTSQQLQYISSRVVTDKSAKILMILDEFASLHLEAQQILEALRKYRKKQCRIMILTQNLADIDVLYGDHNITKALLSNMAFKLLLGGLDEVESQEYFAKLIGYKEKKKYSKTTSSNSSSHTQSEEKVYKIEPADLDRQGKDTAILIFKELPEGYIKLKKNYYFK